jgi:hypothetical protein
MGCDIHLIVERRVNGKWEIVIPHPKRTQYQSHHKLNWDFNRSYDSFALMADVRNGYGFAGIDTGNGFIPISEPRGIPADTTFKESSDNDCYDWLGDHSHSWLTIAEIKAYDWTRRTKKRGFLQAEGYRAWREKGGYQEKGWSGGMIGKGVLTLSNEEMDAYIETPIKDDKIRQTQVEWWADYKEAAGCLWSLVEELDKLNLGKPDDVRLVFGFDS